MTARNYYFGSFHLVCDRKPEKCKGYLRNKIESGTSDVNIKTKQPLTEIVTVIFYATYSSDIIIEDGKVHIKSF